MLSNRVVHCVKLCLSSRTTYRPWVEAMGHSWSVLAVCIDLNTILDKCLNQLNGLSMVNGFRLEQTANTLSQDLLEQYKTSNKTKINPNQYPSGFNTFLWGSQMQSLQAPVPFVTLLQARCASVPLVHHRHLPLNFQPLGIDIRLRCEYM